jgi:hypothetical protein
MAGKGEGEKRRIEGEVCRSRASVKYGRWRREEKTDEIYDLHHINSRRLASDDGEAKQTQRSPHEK